MLQYVNRDFSRKIWRWFYYARLPIFGLPPAYPQPPPLLRRLRAPLPRSYSAPRLASPQSACRPHVVSVRLAWTRMPIVADPRTTPQPYRACSARERRVAHRIGETGTIHGYCDCVRLRQSSRATAGIRAVPVPRRCVHRPVAPSGSEYSWLLGGIICYNVSTYQCYTSCTPGYRRA